MHMTDFKHKPTWMGSLFFLALVIVPLTGFANTSLLNKGSELMKSMGTTGQAGQPGCKSQYR